MTEGAFIAVRREGETFVVAVEPPDPARPPQTYATKTAAWGAAGGLKLVLGLRKVDLTEGADGEG